MASRQSGAYHAGSACGHQRVRAGDEGAAGGSNVVDEEEAAARHPFRVRDGVGMFHVLLALGRVIQGGLGTVVADFVQGSFCRDIPGLPCGLGQEAGLVVAATEIPLRADGDIGYGIELAGELFSSCLDDIAGKDPGAPGFPAEFQGVDALLHGALVVERHRAGVGLLPDEKKGVFVLPGWEGGGAGGAHAVAGGVHQLSAESAFGREKEVKEISEYFHNLIPYLSFWGMVLNHLSAPKYNQHLC